MPTHKSHDELFSISTQVQIKRNSTKRKHEIVFLDIKTTSSMKDWKTSKGY